jgi:hypothetical protein
VFVSSRMHELVDLRAVLKRALQDAGLHAFVYETDKGALADDPETASMRELEKTDVFVLIVGDTYGEITAKEYERARELKKPCLVYVRRNRPFHDPRLDAFLEKLSGPRGVPSRTAFDTAVDLAAQLAKDINVWLTMEYRRLSAERAKPDVPTRRVAEIDERLRVIDTALPTAVPVGSPADYLSGQLRRWFQTLEFPIVGDPISVDTGVDFTIKVPARRGFATTLIRAKEGEIQVADVELARAKLASVDEIWLVSERRVSSAARGLAKDLRQVFVYTFDELLEEDINFDTYFSDIENQIREMKIPQFYVPLKIEVEEHASKEQYVKSKYGNISDFVDQWLADKDAEHLSILGEFGTGKSWFSLYLAHSQIEAYKAARERGLPRPRLPLLVRLRDYSRGFKDVGGLLTDFVFREYAIKIPNYKVLDLLNQMGRLLFIFDGFDEMAERVNLQKMGDNFWALADVLGPGSKAILTCRTEYFRFAQQARDVLSGRVNSSRPRGRYESARFQIATIQMFDDEQLETVLSRHGADESALSTLMKDPDFAELIRRPVMIELLMDAIPYLSGEERSTSEIYFKAALHKMGRDISSGRTMTSIRDKFFFMTELSMHMLAKSLLSVHYKDIPNSIREYFGKEVSDGELDHWNHDLLSQTMLIRDDNGNYKPAHKSFAEFFAALKLCGAAGTLKSEIWDAIAPSPNLDKTSDAKTWAEAFRAADRPFGLGVALKPLQREEMREVWFSLPFDDALRDFCAGMSDRGRLIALAEELGSGGDADPQFAGRIVEVLASERSAVPTSLRAVRLSDVKLHRKSMFSFDLSGSTLSRFEIIGGRIESCRFDSALFKDFRCAGVSFSENSFEGANLCGLSIHTELKSAHWCERGDQEALLVLGEGNFAFLLSTTDGRLTSVSLPSQVFSGSHTTFVSGDSEWRLTAFNTSSNGRGVKSPFRLEYDVNRYVQGDVEVMKAKIVDERDNTETRSFDVIDTSGLPTRADANRFVCASGDGAMYAIVDANDSAAFLCSGKDSLELPTFHGSDVGDFEPDVMSRRLGCFSPSARYLALQEGKGALGVWSTRELKKIAMIDLSSQAASLIAQIEKQHTAEMAISKNPPEEHRSVGRSDEAVPTGNPNR